MWRPRRTTPANQGGNHSYKLNYKIYWLLLTSRELEFSHFMVLKCYRTANTTVQTHTHAASHSPWAAPQLHGAVGSFRRAAGSPILARHRHGIAPTGAGRRF